MCTGLSEDPTRWFIIRCVGGASRILWRWHVVHVTRLHSATSFTFSLCTTYANMSQNQIHCHENLNMLAYVVHNEIFTFTTMKSSNLVEWVLIVVLSESVTSFVYFMCTRRTLNEFEDLRTVASTLLEYCVPGTFCLFPVSVLFWHILTSESYVICV